jgi:hypothetical protein
MIGVDAGVGCGKPAPSSRIRVFMRAKQHVTILIRRIMARRGKSAFGTVAKKRRGD